MNARVFETHSEEETIALGERLAQELRLPCTLLLIGNLGAGKTTMAKGIAKGLGAAEPEDVASPTYTLIHEYGCGRLYHVDLYRLETEREVAALGLDELFERDAAVLIEWGERFPALMPADRMEVRLEANGDSRRITVSR